MRAKRTIPAVCPVCKVDFLTCIDWVRRGQGQHCSKACAQETRRLSNLPRIEIDGQVARFPLFSRSGQILAHAVIDASDAEWVRQWPWSLGSTGYVVRTIDGPNGQRKIRLHRELLKLGHDDTRQVDHIDRDRMNNRRSNLRILTLAQNTQNVSSQIGSTSIYRGVCWKKDKGKWQASVRVGGVSKHLGYFDNEDAAAAAARDGRLIHMPYAVD